MRRLSLLCVFLTVMSLGVLAQTWPEARREARPGVRWWWLGSAVDEENLRWSLQEYSRAGIGAVEITPIYGVQGNDANNIPFLSDRYMEILRFVQAEAAADSIEVDMATGTGWPFGGPWVPLEESACKAVFVAKPYAGGSIDTLDLLPPERDRRNCTLQKVVTYPEQEKVVALWLKRGIMRVKRAAPGGEGYVVDHFDRQSVANYLRHISDAFDRTGTPYPHTFFNDSYEVADGDWTPSLLEEFAKRRGYRLEEHLLSLTPNPSPTREGSTPAAIASPSWGRMEGAPVVADYRETLAELLLENFTEQWTAWAHAHGAITRNQAHGSPANLIDCYAAVDIPEIEGFGLSDFGIKGLRRDPGMTRKNDSDLSMLKYAPSAAHVTGKPLTSSETFTWLTEHFRTSLSQMKPDLDLMFCAGVNRMFFHGTCYSPKDDPWPGWKFYASVDMSPTNSIWRDAPFLMKYIERCQSFLQWGQPDNDFLIYLPVRDMWQKNPEHKFMQFSIHNMGRIAPEFIESVLKIDRMGYDCDYISERLLLQTTYRDGQLVTAAGTRYKALIIPGENIMSEALQAHLDSLQQQGAPIIRGIDATKMRQVATPEAMKTTLGLHMIRRSNEHGHHYFIANLSPHDVDARIPLAVNYKGVRWFNPLNGDISMADFNNEGIGITLRSGESMILQTYDEPMDGSTISYTLKHAMTPHVVNTLNSDTILIDGKWTLSFTEEVPSVGKSYQLQNLQTWEGFDEKTKVTMGTGVYTTTVKLSRQQARQHWMIDLGDVRESARVYINGQFIGCAWAIPFVLDCRDALHKGKNEIRIEVTNLPANRIADLDRKGYQWRKFNEINVVDLNYKKTTYEKWAPMPSGLNSAIRLITK